MGRNVRAALTEFYSLADKLLGEGFTVVGTICVTRGKGKVPGNADLFVAPDERFGVLRITTNPVKIKSLLPQTDPGAFNVPAPASGSLEPILDKVAAMAGDGLSRNTGQVCQTCGGVTFRPAGNCLYCVSCGDSVGGCS